MTTSNAIEEGTDWVERNTYCRKYCASACAQNFANDTNELRTTMVNNYGSCPVIAGTGVQKKYCEEGTYLPANATNDTICSGCEPGYYCPGGNYDLEASTWQGIHSCPTHSTSVGNTSTCKCEVGYSKDGTFEGDINVGYGETCIKIEIDYMSVNSSYYSYNTDIENLESLVERGIVVPRRQGEEISRSNNKIKSLTEYTNDESWSVTFVDANDNFLYSVSGYAFCSTKSNQTTTPIGTRVSYGSIDDQAYVGCWCKLGENGNDDNYWTRLDVVSPNSDDWYEDTNYCRENCPARCAQEVATNQEFREDIYNSDTIPTDTGCETGYAWSSTAYMCKKICVENAHDGGNGYCVCDDGYSVDGTETGATYAEGASCQEILYCDTNEFIISGSCQACPENSHSDGGNVYQCECDDRYTINGRDNGDTMTSGQACIRNSYNIIYDYSNGGFGCANETFVPGIEKELNCIPSNTGYRLIGWYDAVENGNRITSVSTDIDENITLYA